jgi:drug/metabolite transporter (DMT)-like permease
MSILQIACLTLYAAGMCVGQLLFKSVADRLRADEALTFAEQAVRFLKVALDPVFFLAIVLYAGLAVFWVWILSFTPLSRAYPFAALALVFTFLIGVIFFREGVSRLHVIGLALILAGIAFIGRAPS